MFLFYFTLFLCSFFILRISWDSEKRKEKIVDIKINETQGNVYKMRIWTNWRMNEKKYYKTADTRERIKYLLNHYENVPPKVTSPPIPIPQSTTRIFAILNQPNSTIIMRKQDTQY